MSSLYQRFQLRKACGNFENSKNRVAYALFMEFSLGLHTKLRAFVKMLLMF